MCPLAMGYRGALHLRHPPPPSLFLLLAPPRRRKTLASCPRLAAKQNRLRLGGHRSSILWHPQLGWSQTNSITPDNTATARKEPDKWSPLCRLNGPAPPRLSGRQSSAHKHNHQPLKEEDGEVSAEPGDVPIARSERRHANVT